LLYSAKVKIPVKMFSFDIASSRSATDTTLPYSAIDIVTQQEARVTWKYDDRKALGSFARWRLDDYKGFDLLTRTESVGADYAHRFDGGLVATAPASYRWIKQDDVTIPSSLNVQVGLQKDIDLTPAIQPPAHQPIH
jgi:hypothetical protein